ncbi:MAG: leucine-rich repeat domain-containing protein, partial [Muribaculaceae bacterium]|nr:leucine-rich repeat domain-containing protein [Muribaculaceae bacterium]
MKPFYRLLCLLALALLVPPILHAARVQVNGLYYELNSDGTCSVMYLSSGPSNKNYVSGDLVIPEKITYNSSEYSVTSIGSYAFEYCSNLISVSIPNSTTSIDSRAFVDCTSLTKAEFASIESLCSIKFYDAFSNPLRYAKHLYVDREEITELIIPESVTSIGNYAFNGCTGLASVSIPNSITSIGKYAFDDCSGLTKAEFASIESLCSIKFANYASNPLCYAKHLYIDGKEVTELIIPESITSIGDYAFFGCTGLTSVTIPSSVTSIGSSAFRGCSGLTSVTIPNSVTSIGILAFAGCTGLTSVSVGNSVTSIGDYAFQGCTSLTSVNIPGSLTTIGRWAFKECANLFSYEVKNFDQTTATINVKHNGFNGCDIFCDNSKLKIGENKVKGLSPGDDHYFYAKNNVTISLSDLNSTYKFQTNNLTIKSNNKVTASSVEITPKFTIDCDVKEYWNDNKKLKGTRTEIGLDPQTNYSYTYCVDTDKWYKAGNLSATTQQLTMSTLPGVALNSSTALLCSEVNLHEDEVNVGFEWRRYDAPETLPSSKVACAIVDGKLTGALSGLNPTAYYNYRPYYTSNSGKTYYGEWITIFTGDAGVHFDPTVKTYSASMLDDFGAQLKGYALRGSDEIARQGFQYWSNWGGRAAGDVTEVEVKGQQFTHKLPDLHPST